MKTILTSISLLLLSILLVIGCEVLEDSIEKQDEANLEQSAEITDGLRTQMESANTDSQKPSLQKEEIERVEKDDS